MPNKATVEAKKICTRLVSDTGYQKKLRTRLIAGDLAPAVECMLWYYAVGKPKETLEVDAGATLVQLLAGIDDARSK